MTVATFAEPFTGTDHDDFSKWAREVRDYRIERANDRPNIRLYDGDWNFRGTVYGEITGNLSQEVNETGLIQLRLPIDLDDPRRTWAAFWALDEEARGTTNIHIIVETMGARIGGRMKPKNGVTVKRNADGDEVIIDFLDDIEELKFVHTAGNPFLPISLIQQPKAWMLLLEADYAILLTMAANLLRLQLTNLDITDILGLLNPANWTLDSLFHIWEQSQIVIKPRMFGDSVAPLALVVGSINTSIFDVAAPIMEDAELQWDLRRWLTGDPEPWPGAGTNWRNGTLMVGIVDKSGFRQGTSLGGNLLLGLTRTIADVLSNHVEDSYDLFTGATIDETGYRLPGILGTLPAHPYVVYRDGDITGIQTSEFSRSPGGPGRITVGGQSMPGVVLAPRATGGPGQSSQRIDFSGSKLRRRRTRRQPEHRPERHRRCRCHCRVTGRRTGRVPQPHLQGFDPGPHQCPAAAAGFKAGLGSLPGDRQHEHHAGIHRGERDGSESAAPRNRPRHVIHDAGGQRQPVVDRRQRFRALVER